MSPKFYSSSCLVYSPEDIVYLICSNLTAKEQDSKMYFKISMALKVENLKSIYSHNICKNIKRKEKVIHCKKK